MMGVDVGVIVGVMVGVAVAVGVNEGVTVSVGNGLTLGLGRTCAVGVPGAVPWQAFVKTMIHARITNSFDFINILIDS